jgi:DNA-binding CsgD family transcriptional regulator
MTRREAETVQMQAQLDRGSVLARPADPSAPLRTSAQARTSHDAQDRLLAHTLETLESLLPLSAAFAFTVDGDGLMRDPILLRGGGAVEALVRRLPELEPIDPFSPRRAEASGATVMSSADVGGAERLACSMYGRHLRRHGYGAPHFLYLRRAGRVVAGIGVLPNASAPRFDGRTGRLLAGLQPMLQDALELSVNGRERDGLAEELCAAGLTVREAQVAGRVADGRSNGSIADELELSEATVKAHLTKVYAKLGVRTRTQLAALMYEPRP